MHRSAVFWSLVYEDNARVCKCNTVYFFFFFLRTYFYSCHSLLLLRVWNKAVGRDDISYSWKFLVQSPSLKHAMGLPMWIMYGEKETQWGRSMEVKPITLWNFFFYKNFTIITRECGFVGGFVSSLWAHIHPVSIVLYPLCCSTGKNQYRFRVFSCMIRTPGKICFKQVSFSGFCLSQRHL